MKKFALALGLAGVLLLSGCGGGGGGTSGGSTPVQPAPEPEPGETLPMTDQGNYLLLPGYTYPLILGDTYQMHVLEAGNVLFTGGTCIFNIFDSNYNEYDADIDGYTAGNIRNGQTGYFEPGWYYINAYSRCSGEQTVHSDVL